MASGLVPRLAEPRLAFDDVVFLRRPMGAAKSELHPFRSSMSIDVEISLDRSRWPTVHQSDVRWRATKNRWWRWAQAISELIFRRESVRAVATGPKAPASPLNP